MDGKITGINEFRPATNAERARMSQETFYSTCKMIRAAWTAQGYTGDSVITLLTAIITMTAFKP